LWLDFSTDGLAYWNARGPSDCQHHNEPFNKSYRHFSSGQLVICCSQHHSVGTKANGEKYDSGYCIHHQQNQFNCLLLNIYHILLQEKGSVTGEIDHHEKKITTHRDSILTYLTRRQGMGLGQQLEKQIQEV